MAEQHRAWEWADDPFNARKAVTDRQEKKKTNDATKAAAKAADPLGGSGGPVLTSGQMERLPEVKMIPALREYVLPCTALSCHSPAHSLDFSILTGWSRRPSRTRCLRSRTLSCRPPRSPLGRATPPMDRHPETRPVSTSTLKPSTFLSRPSASALPTSSLSSRFSSRPRRESSKEATSPANLSTHSSSLSALCPPRRLLLSGSSCIYQR